MCGTKSVCNLSYYFFIWGRKNVVNKIVSWVLTQLLTLQCLQALQFLVDFISKYLYQAVKCYFQWRARGKLSDETKTIQEICCRAGTRSFPVSFTSHTSPLVFIPKALYGSSSPYLSFPIHFGEEVFHFQLAHYTVWWNRKHLLLLLCACCISHNRALVPACPPK